MPKPFDFGEVNLAAGQDSSGARPEPETPFCVAILGDFSGRAQRASSAEPISKRRAILIDRDNFDEVLQKFGVEIQLPIGDSGSSRLRFAELEDFHPDRVFEHLDAFRKLRDLRARVQDPATFEAAAKELGLRSKGEANAQAQASEGSPIISPSATRLASGSLLDEMIEQTESQAPEDRPKRSTDEVREFARRVAEPHLVSAPDPRQAEIISVLDRAIGALMRAVLHNSDFQALESGWRAVYFLVRRLETGSNLKLYLLDISKEELAADLRMAPDLRHAAIYRLLVEKSAEAGADPWALIVGNYVFGLEKRDVEFLSRMAQVAHRADATFLAEASPQLLGFDPSEPRPHTEKTLESIGDWAGLRHLQEAGSLGLALPRFLLRLPYGKKTSPVESFDFEEFPELPRHEDYLWGDPAFVVALLLAQSFSESGWEMRPGTVSDLDGLPLHIYQRDGDSEAKTCAEILMTDEEVDQILSAGIMPLISFRGSDKVRLARFQSIADPVRGLSGRWMR